VNRNAKKLYQRRMMIAMAVYTIVVMMALPTARSSTDWPTKALLALAPVLPLMYAIWLMAERVRNGDELEQRTHLVGLGVAAAVVSIFSLVGGFLAAAKVLPPEACAAALVWVFPILMLCYGVGQWWVARGYGMDGFCDEESGSFPWYQRLLFASAIMVAVAAWAYWHSADEFSVSFAIGAAVGLVVAGAVGFARYRRQRSRASE
jgi:hypothetical protein